MRNCHLSTVLLVVCLGVSSGYSQSKTQALGPVGTTWGGDHVALEVTEQGATLDFDCATGEIQQAVEINANGTFKAAGSFTRERPGPVMRDGNPTVEATYAGTIQGDRLKLTIRSGPQNESQGEYVLTKGKPGRVLKCK